MRPVGSARGIPAAVVEVQVRVDNDVNFFGTNAGGLEGMRQLLLRTKDAAQFIAELIADSGFDHNGVFAGANDDRVQSQQNAVLLVGRRALLPERLGNHSEHGAAVEEIRPIAEDRQLEVADRCARPHRIRGVWTLCRMGHCFSAVGASFT